MSYASTAEVAVGCHHPISSSRQQRPDDVRERAPRFAAWIRQVRLTQTMQRLLGGAAGVLLVVIHPAMLYGMTVPVPQYRTGTYADYQAFFVSCLTIYSGVVLGIAAGWWRRPRKAPTVSGGGVFRAGFIGGVVAVGVALALSSIRSGPGNLWGLVIIFGGVFAATVSAGAGLVWHAIHGTGTPHSHVTTH
jgi:hypothetical protein